MRFSVSLMSKKTFGVFTILVFLLSLTGNVLADNTITTIHGNSENLGEFTSLALDNSAIPHISYYNSDNGNIYVLTCSNPQCTPFLVARPIDTGTRSSLELNNNGFPVLSYESNGDLKIAVCQDATCLAKTTKILASTGDVGYHNSLELDSSGYPVISYYDATNTSLNLTYCISQPDCSSGIIINREIDNSASVGIYSSLALNSSGFPVISYYDETNGDLKLAVCSDATCVNKATVTVDSAGIVGTYISLALNSNDYPVISYYDNTNSQLKIAVCGNTTCTSGNNITTLDNTVTSGIDSSVALNNNGYPVVSYQNLANRDLKIARCGNSTCSSGNIITTLDAPGDVGGYTSLAINNNNEPVISYFDDSNNNLKLAIADIISPTITLNERASANPSSANSVNFNVAFSETVQNVDVNDFTLTTTGVSGASITSVTLGAFYYTVSVNTGSGNGTIRLDVPSTATIKDLSDNDLSGLPFSSGEVYTISKSTTSIAVTIGGVNQGNYNLAPGSSQRVNYAGVDAGPVKIESTNDVPIIAALREAYYVSGQIESFVQLMGLPAESLSTTYYFPAYNNVSLDDQLRFGNVGNTATTVTVTIAGVVRGTYNLNPGEAKRVNYAGLDAGPVVVQSSGGVPIIAALRDAYYVDGRLESFAQLMGLPQEKLSTKYYFPAYNNVSLDGQLRFGNVGNASTTVTVTIAGVVRGTYNLNPNESKRVNYAGLDAGPVVVESSGGVPITAALRDAYFVDGKLVSFIQLMGLPQEQLSTTYNFPAYNNVSLDGQLRFGNVGNTATTVTVTIAGVVRGTYNLNPSEAKRVNYVGLDAGPVVIQSSGGVPIIAALRDAYFVNGKVESFAQLMGLPQELLSSAYYFPAYNNVSLDGQLRFGVP